MSLTDAIRVLGVKPGSSSEQLRTVYLRLVREHHPDSEGPSVLTYQARTIITAEVTTAYATVREAMREAGTGRVPSPGRPAGAGRAGGAGGRPRAGPPDHPGHTRSPSHPPKGSVEAPPRVISVHAPPEAAYKMAWDAASRVGSIAYFDRELGIIEVICRFEGGPSCSVLLLLGRSTRAPGLTDIECSMESIEAAPTPPITPVVEAITDHLLSMGA